MQVDEQAEDQGVAWTPPATCPKFRERPLPGIDTPDAVVWSVSCQGALSAEGARRVAPLPSPLILNRLLGCEIMVTHWFPPCRARIEGFTIKSSCTYRTPLKETA